MSTRPPELVEGGVVFTDYAVVDAKGI